MKFPLLLKAAFGGGGRGQAVVANEAGRVGPFLLVSARKPQVPCFHPMGSGFDALRREPNVQKGWHHQFPFEPSTTG